MSDAIRSVPPGRAHRALAMCALVTVAMLGVGPASALAQAPVDDALLLTTPYPSVEAQPGSTVELSFRVSSQRPTAVSLEVEGLPDGWGSTLRGGGFVIHQVTAEPEDGASVDLEVAIPPDAAAGEYPISVVADASGRRAVSDIILVIAERVNSGIRLTADFPTLSGEPGGTFSYNLTVANETPVEQTFTFDPSAPQGWTVTASPTAEDRAQTVTIEAGSTAAVEVTATAPQSAEQGAYPIDVAVVAENGGRGTVQLEAEIVGTPSLDLVTADERLNVSGEASAEKRIPLIISNPGTAALESVQLAGTAPSDWDVSFDPQELDLVRPGETAQVTAIVQPSSDAVAGDYSITVRSSAGSLSSNIDLRYTIEGSRSLGYVAIGVIAVAFLALAAVFVKFGRR